MAPSNEQVTKSTTRKRIASPESLANSEPSSEAAMPDSQSSDNITITLQKALKEVGYLELSFVLIQSCKALSQESEQSRDQSHPANDEPIDT